MAFTDGGGVGTVEKFDYEAIKTERVNIETALVEALKALNEGTAAIEQGFGSGGDAMTGGSSNAISNKWNELETVIINFRDYLVNTLDSVGLVSQSTQALEDAATELFGGSVDHNG